NPELTKHWRKTRTVYIDPELYKTYGIIDKDYDHKSNNFNEPHVQGRIVFLNRYNLENYIFDPSIFCSAFKEYELEAIIENDCKIPSNSKVQKGTFLQSCVAIKNCLEQENHQALQPHLDIYFKAYFEMLSTYKNYREELPIERQLVNSIQRKSKNNASGRDL